MSENKKPRLAEVLGVEVGQEFRVGLSQRIFYINSIGELVDHNGFILDFDLSNMINNPQLIHCIRRWTEQDKEDAKALKRMIKNAHHVRRCVEEVSLRLYGKYDDYILTLNNCFAALPPQTEVTLDEIIGGAE